MSILTIVPSRGRPENALRLHQAHEATQVDGAFLVFGVDEDDPVLHLYRRYLPEESVIGGPRLGMVGTLNRVAAWAARVFPEVTILGFMGDDHLPSTVGWDLAIKESMEPLGIVYGDDGIQGPNLPTAAWLDVEIVRKLGFMAHPGLQHLYVDNFWKTLGESLGTLRYLPGMKITHLHPIAGKSQWDEGYVRVNDGAIQEADRGVYERWVESYLQSDLEVLRG